MRMPITWASPAVQGRGNQPPGPRRDANGGGTRITSNTRREEGEDEGGRLQ